MVTDVFERSAEMYREALPIVLVSLVGGLFAGVVLGSGGMRDAIVEVPGLLLMVPAMLATRGNVYGALGARLSTGLHQGLIQPRFQIDRRITNAVSAAVFNGVTISALIGIGSWVILTATGRVAAPLSVLVGISLVAAVLSALTLTVVLLSLLFVGFKRGIDPDILIGPIVTTTGDIFGVAYLYIGVLLVQRVL